MSPPLNLGSLLFSTIFWKAPKNIHAFNNEDKNVGEGWNEPKQVSGKIKRG
jgi:hypothetical protein